MVRSLDSARESSDIAQVLAGFGISSRIQYGSVILDRESLWLAIEASSVFCGFDEVWLLRTIGESVGYAVPPNVKLMSESGPISDEMAYAIAELPFSDQILCALADGVGLNAWTTDHEFWRHLLRSYLPPPSELW